MPHRYDRDPSDGLETKPTTYCPRTHSGRGPTHLACVDVAGGNGNYCCGQLAIERVALSEGGLCLAVCFREEPCFASAALKILEGRLHLLEGGTLCRKIGKRYTGFGRSSSGRQPETHHVGRTKHPGDHLQDCGHPTYLPWKIAVAGRPTLSVEHPHYNQQQRFRQNATSHKC